MTADPPAPGSPWATYCPDAFPAGWLDALGLSAFPAGFARFATDDETALITRAITTPEFLARTGRAPRPATPSPAPRRGTRAAKPEGRFAVLNGFVDAELRKLTRAEMAVWLVLYRDTKPDGTARTGQTDLARRAGCNVRSVGRALDRLEQLGLVEVVRKGRLGAGVSWYRVGGIGIVAPGFVVPADQPTG
jgi:Helix-turn-helix domain